MTVTHLDREAAMEALSAAAKVHSGQQSSAADVIKTANDFFGWLQCFVPDDELSEPDNDTFKGLN